MMGGDRVTYSDPSQRHLPTSGCASLGSARTSTPTGESENLPEMAGFPHHAADDIIDLQANVLACASREDVFTILRMILGACIRNIEIQTQMLK